MIHKHTNNFYSGFCPLLSTHTGVDTTVLWYSIFDGQLQGRVPLFYHILLSIFQLLSPKPPLHWDTWFRELTTECDVAPFLNLKVLQLLLEGDGKGFKDQNDVRL